MASRTTYISICAGGGGLDAGVRLALPDARCVCYVEREVTEAGVLAKGIESGWLDDAPIWSDLFSFNGRAWRGLVDGIIGGIPCQPHSFAGKRLGEHDERNLWPVTARLVYDVAPAWCFFENVPGIAAYYWRDIRPDLQALGYEVAEGIFSAEEVGAPHLRERLFWLAYNPSLRQRSGQGVERERATGRYVDDSSASLTLAYRSGVQPRPRAEQSAGTGEARSVRQAMADALGGGYDGRAPEQRRGTRDRTTAARSGEGVGDAECAGRDGWAAGCDEPSRWAFPPGPGDADGWQRWLSEHPGTEPALSIAEEWERGIRWPLASKAAQSAIRELPDGMARSDWLRVYGNGVVPLAAANALLSLDARMGDRLESAAEREAAAL